LSWEYLRVLLMWSLKKNRLLLTLSPQNSPLGPEFLPPLSRVLPIHISFPFTEAPMNGREAPNSSFSLPLLRVFRAVCHTLSFRWSFNNMTLRLALANFPLFSAAGPVTYFPFAGFTNVSFLWDSTPFFMKSGFSGSKLIEFRLDR